MLFRDLVFAARTLRRSPVFTLAAALTIALGIGASTAIFTVTNSVLLRPLPYKDPDRLVVMYMDLLVRNSLGMPLSNENFVDIRDGSRGSFEDMAAFRTGRQVLPGLDGTPEQVRFAVVTVNFFRVMGASVALGRDFEEADGVPQPAPQNPQAGGAPAAPGPPPLPVVAILSHEYWQRRYGGDPAVLGQRIPGGPRPEIVGVLAPGFELLFPPGDERGAAAGHLDRQPSQLQQRQPKHLRSAAGRPVEARRRARARAGGGRRGLGPAFASSFRCPRAPASTPGSSRCTRRSSRKCGRRSWR